ncbi:low molecular weight protein arginine phosphatase [Ectobacillus ponti]|uniref:Low molecular weight protein arginine phosphatase n=1 Tax=Ectobacillus ponti TaxID=2961894 RepID=A0AA41X9M0_9BACI|nr:low molecular weight protein arginine phosphatase [Ectobacillus ponti]
MKNILFVCTGNTCRSPMAEAVLRHQSKGRFEVKSAGVFAAVGSDASQHAKSALAEQSIDINHTSRQLTEELIKWADLVLTMTRGHKEIVMQSFPGAADKVFTLYEYAGESEEDVADPYGGSLTRYQRTLDELVRLVGQLVKKLEDEQQSL